jgi:hypothetical protein
LSKCVIGASQETAEEEAVNEEETTNGATSKKSNTFKIYGTLKYPEESKAPEFVKETIKVGIFF